VIRHIVVFSVAESCRTELDVFIEELLTLPGEIDEIEAIACGRSLGATGLDAALTVDVADEAALGTYREHPSHQPALERLRAIASQIVVADIAF
jgi:Stress responsive A/B Barrel Domain